MTPVVECPSCASRLKAPAAYVGRTVQCPGCGGMFTLPAPALEAQPVEEPHPPIPGVHQLEAPKTPTDVIPLAEADAPPATRSLDAPRRPCPMCGELILIRAIKCRYCGEVFDETLRRGHRSPTTAYSQEEMNGLEWVLVAACPTAGCIVAIIYILQGQPKGTKVLGITFLFTLLWMLAGYALRAL